MMSNEVNQALLDKLYEDALENLQKYKSLSDEEKEEIAFETAEELFYEMSV
tara:strand:- start:493 stop:645 length:153 start_codon:yes stop_codon:yes gene_type:complete